MHSHFRQAKIKADTRRRSRRRRENFSFTKNEFVYFVYTIGHHFHFPHTALVVLFSFQNAAIVRAVTKSNNFITKNKKKKEYKQINEFQSMISIVYFKLNIHECSALNFMRFFPISPVLLLLFSNDLYCVRIACEVSISILLKQNVVLPVHIAYVQIRLFVVVVEWSANVQCAKAHTSRLLHSQYHNSKSREEN